MLLLFAVALADDDLCLTTIPAPPADRHLVAWDPGAPLPDALVPTDYEWTRAVARRGEFYDEAGHTYDAATTRLILATWYGENPDATAPKVIGTREVTRYAYSSGGGSTYTTEVDVKRRFGGLRKLDHATFVARLCAFHEDRRHQAALKAAGDALRRRIDAAFPEGPRPPFAAFLLAEKAYARLRRPAPRDPEAWLADVAAIEAASQRGAARYDFDEAWADAEEAGSRAPLAELVADLPATPPE